MNLVNVGIIKIPIYGPIDQWISRIRKCSTEMGFGFIAVKHANFICFTTKTDPHPIFIMIFESFAVHAAFFFVGSTSIFFISFLRPYLELST